MRLLILSLALLLTACETYWVKDQPAMVVVQTKYVAAPCGHLDWDGCTRRNDPFNDAATIEIKRGLDKATEACVHEHELYHAQGYDHPDWVQERLDCGGKA